MNQIDPYKYVDAGYTRWSDFPESHDATLKERLCQLLTEKQWAAGVLYNENLLQQILLT